MQPDPSRLNGCGSFRNAAGLEGRLSRDIHNDLQADRLVLPTLPDVAVRIGRAMQDDTMNAARVAEVVQTDPVITTKLIRVANSAFYGGWAPLKTCEGAVVRLGLDTTHKLVLTFALQDLFRTRSAALQERMRRLWKHSTRVSALCFVLAKTTRRFVPEHALLAGLIHDLGEIAILSHLAKYATFAALEEQQIDAVAARLRGEIGALILSQWDFSSDFVTVALQCEDWHRDSHPSADYCDLVIIAQLHSFAGTPRADSLPAMEELPSFRKLKLDTSSGDGQPTVFRDAVDQISSAESLLHY